MPCPEYDNSNDYAISSGRGGPPTDPTQPTTETSNLAICAFAFAAMALVLSVGLCFGISIGSASFLYWGVFLGPLAVLFGIISIGAINGSDGRLRGRGLAYAGIIIGPLALLAVPVYWIGAIEWSNNKDIRDHELKFDAAIWRSDNQHYYRDWPARSCMVDDLISSKKLDGLTRELLIQLLGPPHDKSFPGGARSCDIHWCVGGCRGGMHMDDEWLFITFGPDGKVDRYWLYVD